MKGCSAFRKAPASLFNVIYMTLVVGFYPSAEVQSVYTTTQANWAIRGGRLTPLQRCSRCILPLKPTGLFVVGDLPLCRGAVGVYYHSSQLGYSWWETYPSAEMQSVYTTTQANWAIRGGRLTPLQRCSWCILPLKPTGLFVVGDLPLCRDAVGVYYHSSQLGYSWWETYPSAEVQLVYTTTQANWAIRGGRLTPLQRCSWCILPLKPTGLFVVGDLPLCRDAVGVYYHSSQLGYSWWETYPSAEVQLVYSARPAD